ISSLGDAAAPGTIVTVLEVAATAAEACAAAGDGLSQTVTAVAEAAASALDETPRQLAVLADAGVVDSGGRGLLVLLDALAATVVGHCHERGAYEPEPTGSFPVVADGQAPPQFEVMYRLDGCAPDDVPALRNRLDALGDSVAIAPGTGHADYSIHVHTDDAGAAIEAGLRVGTPSRIQIAALAGGSSGVAPGGWARERAVLAVVDGAGAEKLFAAEGAAVLRPDSGGTDITAHQLMRAIVDTGAAQVMLLPNGFVAAEELVAGCTAAIGWGVDVVPLPTGSMVQGLAALAVHEVGRLAVDDGYSMAAAVGATRYGSVRIAEEDALTWAGPCRTGDGLGIIGDEVLVVRHDVIAAARGLIDLMLGVGGELVTVLLGAALGEDADNVGLALKDHVRQHHLGTELVAYHTGHRGDAVLVGLE
ncbi:MAG TPA: DAK2 domain-containing protein, partial [Mycobacterium sp.]|nr:DAK2 domain-containing protein [Mycobacterium sp.]